MYCTYGIGGYDENGLNKVEIGAEQARKTLPNLLERAHAGEQTIIKKHGVPYAALVPLDQRVTVRREGLLALRGSGAGLWGENVRAWIDDIRNEWS